MIKLGNGFFDPDMSFGEMLEAIVAKSNELPDHLNNNLALELISCDDSNGYSADFSYTKKKLHDNPYGDVHGGIAAALADTCGGYTSVAVKKVEVATTDLSISFLRAMKGDKYHIHVELTHVGRLMVNTMITIKEAGKEDLCCTVMSNYMCLRTS